MQRFVLYPENPSVRPIGFTGVVLATSKNAHTVTHLYRTQSGRYVAEVRRGDRCTKVAHFPTAEALALEAIHEPAYRDALITADPDGAFTDLEHHGPSLDAPPLVLWPIDTNRHPRPVRFHGELVAVTRLPSKDRYPGITELYRTTAEHYVVAFVPGVYERYPGPVSRAHVSVHETTDALIAHLAYTPNAIELYTQAGIDHVHELP